MQFLSMALPMGEHVSAAPFILGGAALLVMAALVVLSVINKKKK